MKIKFFGMFDNSAVRDKNGSLDEWASIKKSWALMFHDPVGWVLTLFVIFLFVMLFFQ